MKVIKYIYGHQLAYYDYYNCYYLLFYGQLLFCSTLFCFLLSFFREIVFFLLSYTVASAYLVLTDQVEHPYICPCSCLLHHLCDVTSNVTHKSISPGLERVSLFKMCFSFHAIIIPLDMSTFNFCFEDCGFKE